MEKLLIALVDQKIWNMVNDNSSAKTLGRRKYLGSLVAGAAALAGCTGGGGDGDDDATADTSGDHAGVGEPGERVPTIETIFNPDWGARTDQFESMLPVLQSNFRDIGVEMEAIPNPGSPFLQDERSHHFNTWFASATPTRFDPDAQTFRWNTGWAGANGRSNPSNYTSYEYTQGAYEQRSAESIEEREEWVTQAHSTGAEDMYYLAMYGDPLFGVYWDDQVDPAGGGNFGVLQVNPSFMIQSEATDGDYLSFATDPGVVETSTHLAVSPNPHIVIWNNLIYSKLLRYNEETFELETELAEDYTVEDNATTFTFTLQEAYFHNGDQVTAEDVKWTYEYIQEYADFFPKGSRIPYESIEVLDDLTVQFNMERPNLPFLSNPLTRWGIMPKEHMQEMGVEETPDTWGLDSDEIIGSGPFQVEVFNPGESLLLEPFDGHPNYSPETGRLFLPFDGPQTTQRAFESREIDVNLNASPVSIGDYEDLDGATVVQSDSIMNIGLIPQMSFGPAKHYEFRRALSQAADRERVVESANNGQAEETLRGTIWTSNHPWLNPEEIPPLADSINSNFDAAREVLEENGWTWDDDGRLHYPEDIDLSPEWPHGEEPAMYPDQFPSIEEYGIEPSE